MKNLFIILIAFLVSTNLLAQTPDFYFNVLSPNIIRTSLAPGEYATVAAGTWGWDGTITDKIEGELVYAAEDVSGFHWLCDSMPLPDYSGKFVLVDRGGCEFGYKALVAQNQGAIGVIIVNIGDDVITMGAGAFGLDVTIPTILITESAGLPLINQLLNNIPVMVELGLSPLDVATVLGHVRLDENEDCTDDPNEMGLGGWQVLMSENGGPVNIAKTKSDGSFAMFSDIGTYDITVLPPNNLWTTCNLTQSVSFSQYDTMTVNFNAQIDVECPDMTIDIEAALLRRCFDNNTYFVDYCNAGTAVAEDAYVDITLDPLVTIVSSSIPYTLQGGNIAHFELGDVGIGVCGDFHFIVEISCDAELGQTLCAEAFIFPDTICIPTNALWTGSNIFIDASCNGDEVEFNIVNKGTGDMANAANYRVLKNGDQIEEGTYQLAMGEAQSFTFTADGATYRVEADQADDFPYETHPSKTIEGCDPDGGDFSTGFINLFPPADYGSNYDEECVEIIGSWDPNDKRGIPFGYGEDHFIERNTDIQYLIRFQNTGTDTAFNIVVLDTLTDLLDLSSIRLGTASHDYEFNVLDEHVLEFRFNDVMLPDSFVNEPASNGFLTFTISQKNNLPLGSIIANSAAIYFDFNAPVITNLTIHTIGENFLPITATHQLLEPGVSIAVFPNPIGSQAVFDLGKTDFKTGILQLYDLHGKLLRTNNFVKVVSPQKFSMQIIKL